jgi:serine/threonine-protein kinase HipA
MARTLDVYLHSELVGNLIQDDDGQMVFDYSEHWLKNSVSTLSHSLPVREERFTRRECRGFFAGILPEENKREIIAKNLGISSQNDYAMLEQIGGECAGAVTFVPTGGSLPEKNIRYRLLDETELFEILKALPHQPLLAGDKEVRLSLAGVQDKIAVSVNDNEILLPQKGSPSTHIIKPAIDRFEGVVYNEAVCMKLADKIGLTTAQVEIRKALDIEYLLVQRYDRKPEPISPPIHSGFLIIKSYIRRLHQEDFCQALGVFPEKKYQSEGGPSLKQCFDLIREVSSTPAIDLGKLLDAVIFNVLIGNHDAHAKNFSILYNLGKTILTGWYSMGLAPCYDLLSTVYYPELSRKMAMKIGGEYISENLFPKHFEKFAEETGLSKPMVVRRVPELAEIVLGKLSEIEIDHEVAVKVIALIKKRCELFMGRFGV